MVLFFLAPRGQRNRPTGMWNFSKVGTWGLCHIIRCSKHVLFGIGFCCSTEPAGLLLFVYLDCEVVHKDPFFSHQQICQRLKVRGSCHFSACKKRWKLAPGLVRKIVAATASTLVRCIPWSAIPSMWSSSCPSGTGAARCGWKSWKAGR